MRSLPLVVREFDVQDEDPRFWVELDVMHYQDTDTTEIHLRGSLKPVLKVSGLNVSDIHGVHLGSIVIDVVPTTLELLFVFHPEPGVDCPEISKFSETIDEYYDFIILVFKSLKNVQYR